jgi:hypothetical protein
MPRKRLRVFLDSTELGGYLNPDPAYNTTRRFLDYAATSHRLLTSSSVVTENSGGASARARKLAGSRRALLRRLGATVSTRENVKVINDLANSAVASMKVGGVPSNRRGEYRLAKRADACHFFSAVLSGCDFLVTHNVKDFTPGSPLGDALDDVAQALRPYTLKIAKPEDAMAESLKNPKRKRKERLIFGMDYFMRHLVAERQYRSLAPYTTKARARRLVEEEWKVKL